MPTLGTYIFLELYEDDLLLLSIVGCWNMLFSVSKGVNDTEFCRQMVVAVPV